jgi:hypothetical protein
VTCKACEEAEQNPLTGSFWGGCRNCEARALADSPAAFRAMRAITHVDIQQAIQRVFGLGDSYEEGKQQVWYWMKRIQKAKEENGQARNSSP